MYSSGMARSDSMARSEFKSRTAEPKRLDPTAPARDDVIHSLRQKLEKNIIGQPEAVECLIRLYQTYLIGFNPSTRPVRVLLFAGSTGTGKTHSVECFAEALFGERTAYTKIDCAEFQHSHEISKLLGCFTPETPVLMHDGSRKAIKDVSIGDSVITKTGDTGTVIDKYEYPHDGNMLQIEIAGNAAITVTKGHEIWAIRGRGRTRPTTHAGRDRKSLYDPSKLEFIHAGDLKAGDIVVYPRFKPVLAKSVTMLDLAKWATGPKTRVLPDSIETDYTTIPRYVRVADLARLFGYFVAEGNVDTKQMKNINFTFNKNEVYAIDDLYRNLRDTFGNGVSTEITYRKSTDRIYIHNRVIAKMFAELCGHIHYNKRVPDCIVHGSTDVVVDFLDAAFVGDGGKTVKRRVDYSTVSLTLASQIEMLIRSLGFASQMQITHPKNPKFQVRYRIYVSGDQVERFVSNLRLMSTRVHMPGVPKRIQRECFADKEYIYYQIRNIVEIPYSGKVYDISVENAQSYIVHAASVHNSPPGYLGHRETPPFLSQENIDRHQTEKIKINIVLFDEIEKANMALWNLLLGVMDKGHITLGNSGETDFTNSVIIMTTNLGAAEMNRLLEQSGIGFTTAAITGIVGAATKAIRSAFTPEFINRIDETVIFRQLDKDNQRAIVDLEMQAVQNRIMLSKGPAFFLNWTPAAADFIIDKGTDPRYGSRELKRVIEKLVVQPVTNLIISDQIESSDTVTVDVNGGELAFYGLQYKHFRPKNPITTEN